MGRLATAIDTLRRAADLLGDSDQGVDANRSLLDALALAGRLAEAIEVSDVIRHSAPSVDATATATVHVRLAQAAVAATRWALARHQVELADEALGGNPEPALRSQLAVLDAEVAYADLDLDHARALAEAQNQHRGCLGPDHAGHHPRRHSRRHIHGDRGPARWRACGPSS